MTIKDAKRAILGQPDEAENIVAKRFETLYQSSDVEALTNTGVHGRYGLDRYIANNINALKTGLT